MAFVPLAVHDRRSDIVPEEAERPTPHGASDVALHTAADLAAARLPGPRVPAGLRARHLLALGRLAAPSPGHQDRPRLRRFDQLIPIPA